jgi:hypothetical protein
MSDEGTFSIRVVDEDGRPVSNREVTIDYGTMRGVGTEYTDDDGWAEFSTFGYSSVGRIWIKKYNSDMLITSTAVEVSDGESTYDGANFFASSA